MLRYMRVITKRSLAIKIITTFFPFKICQLMEGNLMGTKLNTDYSVQALCHVKDFESLLC